MRTNYVLIDWENIKRESLDALEQEHFRLRIFVGANQNSLPFEIADTLQRMGKNAEYIKISGNGPNALDFHIAYYIGQLAAADPTGYFHIISKDKGFDPLIQHLRDKKISIQREESVQEILLIKTAKTTTLEEKISIVTEKLLTRKSGKPAKVKTLSSTIAALFQNKLTLPEIDNLLVQLQKKKLISVTGTKVTYTLESPPAPK